MNTEITLGNLMTMATLVFGAITGWFTLKFQVERLKERDVDQQNLIEERHNEQRIKIDAIVKWSHDHEREAYEQRDKFNKEISRLEGSLLVTTEQFKQVLNRLEEIIERLSRLERK